MINNATKIAIAGAFAGVILVTAYALTQPTNISIQSTPAAQSAPGMSEQQKSPVVIGPVETKTPPPASREVMTGPTSTNSTGLTETGPHGTVDPAKPVPAVPPTAPRIEEDRPVTPKS